MVETIHKRGGSAIMWFMLVWMQESDDLPG